MCVKLLVFFSFLLLRNILLFGNIINIYFVEEKQLDQEQKMR